MVDLGWDLKKQFFGVGEVVCRRIPHIFGTKRFNLDNSVGEDGGPLPEKMGWVGKKFPRC